MWPMFLSRRRISAMLAWQTGNRRCSSSSSGNRARTLFTAARFTQNAQRFGLGNIKTYIPDHCVILLMMTIFDRKIAYFKQGCHPRVLYPESVRNGYVIPMLRAMMFESPMCYRDSAGWLRVGERSLPCQRCDASSLDGRSRRLTDKRRGHAEWRRRH